MEGAVSGTEKLTQAFRRDLPNRGGLRGEFWEEGTRKECSKGGPSPEGENS